MMKNTAPYMTIFGEMSVRFLQNADDPTRIIRIVEYDAPESMEANRQSAGLRSRACRPICKCGAP